MELKDAFMELYRYISVDEMHYVRENGDASRLSYMDTIYLDIIFLNDGCSPSYIADQLGIARSAVTVRLNRLAKDGWVEKTRDEMDRRAFRLRLTDRSMAEFQPLLNLFSKFQDRIRRRFTDEEQELVTAMIHCAISDE